MGLFSVLKSKINHIRKYRQAKKEFSRRLRVIQKEHTPDKWEARASYNWKKEWGPFIKYDADWDSAYLLDLIIYKLEKMYIELDIFSNEVREDLDPKLAKLKETIELGKKIQTFDYDTESHAFSSEHVTHYVLIYKHTGAETTGEGKIKFQTYKNEELIHKLPRPKMSIEEEVDYEIRTRDWMGSETAYKWAEDNGYNRKDIHLAYSGEWDDDKNHDEWLKILKKEQKALQKDKDDFFKLISRNCSEWWW